MSGRVHVNQGDKLTFQLFSLRFSVHERVPQALGKDLLLHIDCLERWLFSRLWSVAVSETGEIALLFLLECWPVRRVTLLFEELELVRGVLELFLLRRLHSWHG